MGIIFLYGDLSDNFETTAAPFVKAAGGRSARIALLLVDGTGWERYMRKYRDPLLHLGAAAVTPIISPETGGTIDDEAISALMNCSGVFMGGGNTGKYHRAYVASKVGNIILSLHCSGIPFGGVSAGAILTTEICCVRRRTLTTPTGEDARRAATKVNVAEEVVTAVHPGLGLLRGCLVEPHFRERGRFPLAIAAMEKTGVPLSLGIDEPVCLEVSDGNRVKVHGHGRAYVLRFLAPSRFEVSIWEPGDEFELLARFNDQKGVEHG